MCIVGLLFVDIKLLDSVVTALVLSMPCVLGWLRASAVILLVILHSIRGLLSLVVLVFVVRFCSCYC